MQRTGFTIRFGEVIRLPYTDQDMKSAHAGMGVNAAISMR
jgi:hypothetical protein